jgi:cytochrome P450
MTATVPAPLRTPPAPRRDRAVGHLGRWGREPLALLEEGAQLGPVFTLRLWRPAVVGYSPDWNRFVLKDLQTFPSRGSMSGLSPHLAAGLVQTDGAEHAQRRAELRAAFTRSAVARLRPRIVAAVTAHVRQGEFDAVGWSAAVVRDVLSTTFFADRLPAGLLADFLRPLDLPLPWPFLRRPRLFSRMTRAIQAVLPQLPPDTLGAAFTGLAGGPAELRVAVSAGYDTTAHTLAWLLHHVAGRPDLLSAGGRALAINEVLRLYPAGWLGSRRCAHDTTFDGMAVRQGNLVLYSPYLSHRDPRLWRDPLTFRPERFDREPVPGWGFLPFAAGPRTCLGSWFARLVLETVLTVFADAGRLHPAGGDPTPRAGLTLTPSGPLPLRLTGS